MAAPSSDFDALYGQATDLVKAFPEFQFKTVTAMLVIIGWLISSDTAQKFIKHNADFVLPWGIAAFVLLAALKGIWIHGHWKRMNALHSRLAQLAPAHSLSAEGLAQLRIGGVLPATYFLVNTVLCAVGIVVLCLVGR